MCGSMLGYMQAEHGSLHPLLNHSLAGALAGTQAIQWRKRPVRIHHGIEKAAGTRQGPWHRKHTACYTSP